MPSTRAVGPGVCSIPSMPLLRELLRLSRATVHMWLRFFPVLGIALGIGWIIYTLGLVGSATLGTTADPLPSIVFALGVCGSVVGMIMAIAALKPGMQAPGLLVARPEALTDDGPVPREVFKQERPVEIALTTIGPVMAVYAVWALLDQMIRDGLLWNMMLQGYGNPTWSVSLAADRFPTYLAVGVGALVLRIVWGAITRRRSSWWRAPLVFFEGLWTAMSFFVVLGLLNIVQEWMWTREFYAVLERGWYDFIASLPQLRLPFDTTLPEAVLVVSRWVSESLLPGIWIGVVLPLMWLTVTAMVFGWREFNLKDLLKRETRERVEQRLQWTQRSTSYRILSRFGFLVDDLRTKYIPLIHAWRLVWRAGPFLLGAFLILSALLAALGHLLGTIALEITSRIDQTIALLAADFAARVLLASLSVCLYAVAFDRSVKEALHLAPPAGSSDLSSLPPPVASRPMRFRDPVTPATTSTRGPAPNPSDAEPGA